MLCNNIPGFTNIGVEVNRYAIEINEDSINTRTAQQ